MLAGLSRDGLPVSITRFGVKIQAPTEFRMEEQVPVWLNIAGGVLAVSDWADGRAAM